MSVNAGQVCSALKKDSFGMAISSLSTHALAVAMGKQPSLNIWNPKKSPFLQKYSVFFRPSRSSLYISTMPSTTKCAVL